MIFSSVVAIRVFKIPSNYKKGYMFTISNSDERRCNPWKEEAITGLKNVEKQKD
jgi:hypothetical protein